MENNKLLSRSHVSGDGARDVAMQSTHGRRRKPRCGDAGRDGITPGAQAPVAPVAHARLGTPVMEDLCVCVFGRWRSQA